MSDAVEPTGGQRTEEALPESEELVRALLNATGQGVNGASPVGAVPSPSSLACACSVTRKPYQCQQSNVVATAGGAEQADQPVAVGAEDRFGGQTLTLNQHPSILSRVGIPQLSTRPLDRDASNTRRDC